MKNVKAYLNATVRRGLYQLLKKKLDYSVPTLSIEKRHTDDGATLGDTLETSKPGRTADELQYIEKVEDAVHTALSQCRVDEQEYACAAFELTGYTPVASEKRAYRGILKQERRTDNLLRSIKRVFYKHPQIQGLIQREMTVL